MTFIPKSEIDNEELLYRAIPNKPNFWKDEENRPSSALFKDDKGVSVDRDGEREEPLVIVDVLKNRKGYGLGKIQAGIAQNQVGVYCKADPFPAENPENQYHALIMESKDKISISNGKAKKLSKLITTLIKPEENK